MASNPGAPDPSVIAEIRQIIGMPKGWVASGEIAWVDTGGQPRGYRFRERLSLPDGTLPASLFVQGYFKPSHVPGNPDKVNLGLHYHHHRVFAVDVNGPSSHLNRVGIGRPYFGQRVGHPQMHTVSDDAIYGYAEPLEEMTHEGYWEYFLAQAGITGAPSFKLPTLQLGLL